MKYWGKFKSMAVAVLMAYVFTHLPGWYFDAFLEEAFALAIFSVAFYKLVAYVDSKEEEIQILREEELKGGYWSVRKHKATR